MSTKPIFLATHPRACSTVFERVFMTCRDSLTIAHEPFGDAWYFGPERLANRYKSDEKAQQGVDNHIGMGNVTFAQVFEALEEQTQSEGKRLFIKDMIQYWVPPESQTPSIAPSLESYRRGVGTDETGNPTIVPVELLKKYHFTFLIRHPRSSIPSYFRCTVPPLQELTGFEYFDPEEAGYKELRALFDYLRETEMIGPQIAGHKDAKLHSNEVKGHVNGNGECDDEITNEINGHHPNGNGVNGHAKGSNDKVEICLIDADDLLDNPYGIVEAYCRSVGIDYSPSMLKWDDEETLQHAQETFEKWKGFHEDAIGSKEFKPRTHKKAPKSDEQLMADWTEKYGIEHAKVIKKTVDDNVEHYEYLKQFALRV